MQGIELVLRIKPRHDLVRFDPVADIRQSLDHAPPDTKGETGLVLCLDAPGECNRFAGLAIGDRHRADRARVRRYA
jgi:hypothetical protein